MSSKMLLRAGAGLGALALAATPALARPAKHATVKHSSESEEIRALKAEVEALTSRLDTQEANQQATQQALHDAQTAAAAAASEAQAAQASATAAASAVPAQVKVALDKEPRMKPQWFDNTTVSGRMYFNFSNVSQKDGGVRPNGSPNGVTNGTGFNIKRMYLGIDHTFDKTFSANLTMDVANVVGRTANSNFNAFSAPSDAQLVGRGFYIKKAYLQAKISPALIIRAGAADLPWIPYVEGIYGYRHIENTVTDRLGFGTSADWGIHALGDLAGGLVSYQLSVVDGAGYRNVKVTKSVDVEGRVSVAYKNFNAAVGGYYGKLGKETQNTSAPHSATRLNALVAYKDKRFTVGGEYFYAKDWSNNGLEFITQPGSSPTPNGKTTGWSVFASAIVIPKVSVFGRYDWVKPNYGLNNFSSMPTGVAHRDQYFNVGVQYSPAKIVDLALVYKHEKVRGGALSTTNGTIGLSSGSIVGGGNTVLAPANGTYDEFGLFGQFKF
jgi:hypothetical protein